MNIIVAIGGDNSVAMNDAQLAALNAVLAETPVVDRYGEGKPQEKKRIRLEAVMTIKTRQYDVA